MDTRYPTFAPNRSWPGSGSSELFGMSGDVACDGSLVRTRVQRIKNYVTQIASAIKTVEAMAPGDRELYKSIAITDPAFSQAGQILTDAKWLYQQGCINRQELVKWENFVESTRRQIEALSAQEEGMMSYWGGEFKKWLVEASKGVIVEAAAPVIRESQAIIMDVQEEVESRWVTPALIIGAGILGFVAYIALRKPA